MKPFFLSPIKLLRNHGFGTLLGLILGLSLAGYSVFAWAPPASSPPGGNTAAPVNVSGTAQGKLGSLGVGLAVPGYMLDVLGDINTTGNIRDGGVSIYTTSTNSFNANGLNANGLYVTGTSYLTGNVGIGQPSGSNPLEVTGKVKITDGTQGSGNVLTSDTSGVGSWIAPSGGGTCSKTGDFCAIADAWGPASYTCYTGSSCTGTGYPYAGYGGGILWAAPGVTPQRVYCQSIYAGGCQNTPQQSGPYQCPAGYTQRGLFFADYGGSPPNYHNWITCSKQ